MLCILCLLTAGSVIDQLVFSYYSMLSECAKRLLYEVRQELTVLRFQGCVHPPCPLCPCLTVVPSGLCTRHGYPGPITTLTYSSFPPPTSSSSPPSSLSPLLLLLL